MKQRERSPYHPNAQGRRLIIVFRNSLKEPKTRLRRTYKRGYSQLEKFGGVLLVNQE
jgi:hypothetical protein